MASFSRVLIANRGEIACRIIRACRKLDLESVAIFSEADKTALHTELADFRLEVGPAPARDSYLNIPRILGAAAESGAEAVHPGYGFLSESVEFATAVADAGLTWIGPAPLTIADMGDKERARAIAAEAGVPVLPGSGRFVRDNLHGIEDAASLVGYPLLVKAASGGGGIGMRRVDTVETLREVAATTQELAARFFGTGDIYLERFVMRPRHIEIQIFGDGRGNAVHLFERECSIQRRFQKVIEESPAPGLPADIRDRLTRHAVRLAEVQSYAGPGTVEFLVDDDTGDFFFLEMNTRIQVEHPVTEMVTGIDLIELQLKLARGDETIPQQGEIELRGHAVECRLYAENPRAGFRPSPGRLTTFRLPSRAQLRMDFGYREGDLITPYYDPLIGKVIASGDDRATAIENMSSALDEIQIGGLTTNLEFLQRIVAHPSFRAGAVDTFFVERHSGALLAA